VVKKEGRGRSSTWFLFLKKRNRVSAGKEYNTIENGTAKNGRV
jgi:hypothetical protein